MSASEGAKAPYHPRMTLDNISGIRDGFAGFLLLLQRGGNLRDGSHCGLFNVNGRNDLSNAWWNYGGRT